MCAHRERIHPNINECHYKKYNPIVRIGHNGVDQTKLVKAMRARLYATRFVEESLVSNNNLQLESNFESLLFD